VRPPDYSCPIVSRAIYFSFVMKSARDSDKPSRDRIDAIDLTEEYYRSVSIEIAGSAQFRGPFHEDLSLLDSRGNAFSRDALDAL